MTSEVIMAGSPRHTVILLPEFGHSPVSSEGHVMKSSLGLKRAGSPVSFSLGLVSISAGHAFPRLSSLMSGLVTTLVTLKERISGV